MATILAHPTLASRPGLIGAFEARTGLRLFPTASGRNIQALPAIGSLPFAAMPAYGPIVLQHSIMIGSHQPTGPEAA